VVKKTTLALLLLGAMGCESCQAKEALRGALSGTPAERERVERPSDEETRAFFESLSSAARSGDAAAVNRHIDWQAVAARATRGLTVSEEALKGLIEGASTTAEQRGLSAQLAEMSQGAASLRRLGEQERDGETWYVARLTIEGGGFDHLGFLLETQNGRARAVDLWQLTVGESSSEVMRRMLLPTVVTGPENVVDRLTGKEREYVEHIGKIAEAQKLAAEGRGHDALHLLDGLPEGMQRERFVLLTRVGLAQFASQQEHLAEIEALAEAFPDDPTTQVHLIDGYMMQGRPDKSLEALDRIEGSVVRDPFLDVIRANLLGAMGRWSEAKIAAERAIAAEAELEDAYWPALVASVIVEQFDETTRLLKTMREKFGTEIDPEQLPIYAEYVKSPAYQEYKASLAE
jgi:hypothetical protein